MYLSQIQPKFFLKSLKTLKCMRCIMNVQKVLILCHIFYLLAFLYIYHWFDSDFHQWSKISQRHWNMWGIWSVWSWTLLQLSYLLQLFAFYPRVIIQESSTTSKIQGGESWNLESPFIFLLCWVYCLLNGMVSLVCLRFFLPGLVEHFPPVALWEMLSEVNFSESLCVGKCLYSTLVLYSLAGYRVLSCKKILKSFEGIAPLSSDCPFFKQVFWSIIYIQ